MFKRAMVGMPRCGVRTVSSGLRLLPGRRTAQPFGQQLGAEWRAVPTMLIAAILVIAPVLNAQTDPASEPAVLAVAKVLPAVVSINTERVVRHRVRDPFEDFAAQFFGN